LDHEKDLEENDLHVIPQQAQTGEAGFEAQKEHQ
jgi:hypothetical protein